MIKETKGNLLEYDVEALVNTVNTVGVMGKGIALQFRKAFPNEYFKDYKKACENGELELGKVHIYHLSSISNPKYIINFPTKKHWRAKSKIENIESGLENLVAVIKDRDIKSIAIPPLGCGNGGLRWKDIKPLIEEHFAQLPDVEVLLFAPGGSPKATEMKNVTKRPKMTPARAAFVALFHQYLLPGYKLSMLEVQKLAYFLQEAGEDLKLKFEKQNLGPYANNVNHLLQVMDNHFIDGYGDRTQKALEPTMTVKSDALAEAEAFLKKQSPSTIKNLESVFLLIDGFEYPHGMELLSTVHWVMNKNPSVKNDLSKVVSLVHSWNARKRKIFPEKEIEVAWKRLINEI